MKPPRLRHALDLEIVLLGHRKHHPAFPGFAREAKAPIVLRGDDRRVLLRRKRRLWVIQAEPITLGRAVLDDFCEKKGNVKPIDGRRRVFYPDALNRVKTIGHTKHRLEAVKRQGVELAEVLLCVPLAYLQFEAGAVLGRVDHGQRLGDATTLDIQMLR